MGNRYICKYTFEEWCFKNNRMDIIDLWDYEKNDKLPSEVPYGTKKRYWFKCPNGIHESETKRISNITDKPSHQIQCLQCTNGFSGRTRENLTGQVFGELTVVEWDNIKSKETKNSYWICKCSCGNMVSVSAPRLKSGYKTICGGKFNHRNMNEINNNKNIIDMFNPDYLKELRSSPEYSQYRRHVMEKDGYKCIICGSHNIEVHHIYPFSSNPHDRFNPDTGICMCKEHHSVSSPISFHSIYGRFDNTPEQLEEYVNIMRQMIGNYEYFDVYDYMNNIESDDIDIDDSMLDLFE